MAALNQNATYTCEDVENVNKQLQRANCAQVLPQNIEQYLVTIIKFFIN